MDTADPETLDRADMKRLAGGHDASLDDLMERHAAGVFHFLCRMLANEDDANDLAQETFVRVYQHRTRYKPGAKFTPWLYTIAANLARNHIRWRTRHPNVSLDTEAGDGNPTLGETLPSSLANPSQAVEASERAAAVRTAVARLPEDLREALVLCEWENLRVADAATVLNTTPKAVEARLYRARALLRERLQQWL
jgi:RNA polymerase sigma-70 factor (ECF subfamily)